MSATTKQADPASVRQDQLVSLRWWVRGWYRLVSKCCIRGPFDRVNEVGEREDKARLRLERAKQANKDSTTPVAERSTTGALTDRPPEGQ